MALKNNLLLEVDMYVYAPGQLVNKVNEHTCKKKKKKKNERKYFYAYKVCAKGIEKCFHFLPVSDR